MTTVNSATSPAASTATAAQTDSNTLNANFDDFLTLLTTQLQNQDPLSPMDSTEFTNQLVQFSSVEQQIKSNDTLTQLLSAQTLNMTSLGVSFIGKNVQIAGNDFSIDGTGGTQDFAYTLPATATTGTISITDGDGNVVYTKDMTDVTAGTHNFTWDGTNDSGYAAPAGDYTLTVSATGTDGNSLNVTSFVPGYVSGIQTADDGSLQLNVGGNTVPITSVRQVSENTTAANNTAGG
jgi:flagellar basal-body rod modification protein FlgD